MRGIGKLMALAVILFAAAGVAWAGGGDEKAWVIASVHTEAVEANAALTADLESESAAHAAAQAQLDATSTSLADELAAHEVTQAELTSESEAHAGTQDALASRIAELDAQDLDTIEAAVAALVGGANDAYADLVERHGGDGALALIAERLGVDPAALAVLLSEI